MAETKTTVTAATAKASSHQPKKSSNLFATLAVPICLVIGFLFFFFVLGNPANFQGNNPDGHPIDSGIGKWFGTVYKGGYVVPVLISVLLVCLTFVIERFLYLSKAKGKFSGSELVRKVQYHLANKNVDAALAECDKQKGSVGNVLKAGLKKYKEMVTNADLDTEQKILTIKNEIEETTALELPMMEKNLVFLSTIASVATLLGLFGTVLGMIKAFSAMSSGGAPDSAQLALGISEALINTALGIGTSAIAIVMYNYFTTNIDSITYAIDESGFTLTQSFAANHK
ncbi:biopolymer transport protein ExbB [Chitinophaga ginsengisegetis]|uniref:Biopolymer transport protein ExbB n=1 Tax=Chitinophaga ginsengisegetis TaxID=393003 RepID=A0A1T5P480_9BACT|nr:MULTISPECIES: MotA/TolQ/ExbB proton channel family protein [Chitinophaga]MDR6566571.1 biopolymer transport protein ExbB [Chitinophaga ginsengisegetis]MDR6646301.1 biopolymer transport protein ExbB [Chitinophaga ginsengisegetis]MDR6652651.1 biopolymer transport protein ExbB [Chitinophaga ginsengisegetis]SKD07109.1 biopolymer transport protein ExbB [Chitinophaga ginsengisegetis]HWV67383.1 MotA/TolQ/ExbB proton channel family protein [Chitinophaga sp.]